MKILNNVNFKTVPIESRVPIFCFLILELTIVTKFNIEMHFEFMNAKYLTKCVEMSTHCLRNKSNSYKYFKPY